MCQDVGSLSMGGASSKTSAIGCRDAGLIHRHVNTESHAHTHLVSAYVYAPRVTAVNGWNGKQKLGRLRIKSLLSQYFIGLSPHPTHLARLQGAHNGEGGTMNSALV